MRQQWEFNGQSMGNHWGKFGKINGVTMELNGNPWTSFGQRSEINRESMGNQWELFKKHWASLGVNWLSMRMESVSGTQWEINGETMGNRWEIKNICENHWTSVGFSGLSMRINGKSWKFMNIKGDQWAIYRAINESIDRPLSPIDFHRFPLVSTWFPIGLPWISDWFQCTSIGFHWFSWIAHWVPLIF